MQYLSGLGKMYILILNVNWCKLVQFGFLSEPKLNQTA